MSEKAAEPEEQGALERLIRAEIESGGPMRLDRYMALCLSHPEYGYYTGRDPLGVGGDFTTAPEISQMFGEMIGAWLADLWQRSGQPDPFILAECGPGRGTLMRDALRAVRGVPGFLAAARICLVEISPVLRGVQRETLAGYEIDWHDGLESLPEDAPLFLIGNEFLDALPIRQFRREAEGMCGETAVGLRGGRLDFVMIPAAEAPDGLAAGGVKEVCPAALAFTAVLRDRLARQSGAALLIDYGYDGAAAAAGADTFQAVRGHRYASPLEAPGACDLTAHVDFAALRDVAAADALAVHGPVPQGAFLERLGIGMRAAALRQAGDTTARAAQIDAALARLTGPGDMGTLFKVMALTAKGVARPAGF